MVAKLVYYFYVTRKLRIFKRLTSLGIVTICFSLVLASAALAALPQFESVKNLFMVKLHL